MIRSLHALIQRIVGLVLHRMQTRRAGEAPAVERMSFDATTDYTDSDPIVPSLDEEQAAALERVRQIYHRGSQPLTVAKARYDLIRRGLVDADNR